MTQKERNAELVSVVGHGTAERFEVDAALDHDTGEMVHFRLVQKSDQFTVIHAVFIAGYQNKFSAAHPRADDLGVLWIGP